MPLNRKDNDPDCNAIVRTIRMGGLTKTQLLQEFQRHSISMNAMGERLFEAASFSDAETSSAVETVELTVQQLGFTEGAFSAQIFARACELGLELCPLELGPYLRLQYLDQPEGYWITIASKKLPTPADIPNGFYVRRLEDRLWLRGYTATPDHPWQPEEHFIFVRREHQSGS